MYFLPCEGSGSPPPISSTPSYATASRIPENQWDAATPESTVRFDDEAAIGDFAASTLILPPAYICRSATNGIWKNEAAAAIKSPKNTITSFGSEVKRRVFGLSWTSIKTTLSDLVDTATDGVNAHLNHAFDGCDVPEMGNKVVDTFPTVRLPSRYKIHTAIDRILDIIQGLLEREPPKTTTENANIHGRQWLFAHHMGYKARRALVQQGICAKWQILPSQLNLKWQTQLNQALTQVFTYHRDEYPIDVFLNMEPKWIGDRAKGVWRLVLDTGMDDWDLDEAIYLHTGFELQEAFACISAEDHGRGSCTAEGSWENVD